VSLVTSDGRRRQCLGCWPVLRGGGLRDRLRQVQHRPALGPINTSLSNTPIKQLTTPYYQFLTCDHLQHALHCSVACLQEPHPARPA
jgi:hypothetical protein